MTAPNAPRRVIHRLIRFFRILLNSSSFVLPNGNLGGLLDFPLTSSCPSQKVSLRQKRLTKDSDIKSPGLVQHRIVWWLSPAREVNEIPLHFKNIFFYILIQFHFARLISYPFASLETSKQCQAGVQKGRQCFRATFPVGLFVLLKL